MFKKATFMIKRKFNKAIDKIMTMEDRIDYSIYRLDDLIIQFGEARSKLLILQKNEANQKSLSDIENKIREIYKKREDLAKKKDELIAKEHVLKAELEAAKAVSKISGASSDYNGIITECDAYLKNLEASIDTQNFINSLWYTKRQ